MASRIARRACDRVAQGCRTAATLGKETRKHNTPTAFRRWNAVYYATRSGLNWRCATVVLG
jgi:hypothetical protein